MRSCSMSMSWNALWLRQVRVFQLPSAGQMNQQAVLQGKQKQKTHVGRSCGRDLEVMLVDGVGSGRSHWDFQIAKDARFTWLAQRRLRLRLRFQFRFLVSDLGFGFSVFSFVIEKLVQVFCRVFSYVDFSCSWQTDVHFGKRKNQILKLNQFISQLVDSRLTSQTHSAWILAMDKLVVTFKSHWLYCRSLEQKLRIWQHGTCWTSFVFLRRWQKPS